MILYHSCAIGVTPTGALCAEASLVFLALNLQCCLNTFCFVLVIPKLCQHPLPVTYVSALPFFNSPGLFLLSMYISIQKQPRHIHYKKDKLYLAICIL